MHAIDLVDGKAVHQPVPDHGRGAATALLRGLKDHHRGAGEIPRLRQIAGGAEQHRGVAVVATGVHLARGFRSIGDIGGFLDRQRIHVGAQPDHPDVAVPAGFMALDDAYHAGSAKTGCDFIAAEFPQPLSHEGGGAVHIVEQFGVGVDIAAPSLNVWLQIGDAIDDRHGARSRLNNSPLLARKPRSAQTLKGLDPAGGALAPLLLV